MALSTFFKGPLVGRIHGMKDILISGADIRKFNATRHIVENMVFMASAAINGSWRQEDQCQPNPYLVILVNEEKNVDLIYKMVQDLIEEQNSKKIQGRRKIVISLATGLEVLAEGIHPRPPDRKIWTDIIVSSSIVYSEIIRRKVVEVNGTQFILCLYAENSMTPEISSTLGEANWPKTRSFVMCTYVLDKRISSIISDLLRPNHDIVLLPSTPAMQITMEQKVFNVVQEVRARPAGEKIVILCENIAANDNLAPRIKTIDGFNAIAPNRNSPFAEQYQRGFDMFKDGRRNVIVITPNELQFIDLHMVQRAYNLDAGLQSYIFWKHGAIYPVLVRGRIADTSSSEFLEAAGY